jgi:hypothetical protein
MPVVPKLYETQKWENLSPSPSAANHGRTIASRRRHHPPCARAHQLCGCALPGGGKTWLPPTAASRVWAVLCAHEENHICFAPNGDCNCVAVQRPRGIWQPKTGNGSSAARFQIPRPAHIPRPGRWAAWLSCIIRGDTVPT